MSNTDNLELLEFINKKCEEKEVTYPSQLLYFFCKSVKTSLINTYKEQKNINLSISCANIISYIFKIIYSHSLNLKLSMFTCERAILLFNEYINISNSYQSDSINITDIKQFIINKSIGPLILKKSENCMTKYTELFDTIFKFIIDFFLKFILNDEEDTKDLSYYIENLTRILSPSFIELYDNELYNYIDIELFLILNTDASNIIESINLYKIKFEILLALLKKKNPDFALEHIDKIINNNKIIKKLLLHFNEDENIKESMIFRKLIKNI